MQKYALFIGIDISRNWIDVCLTLDGKITQMPHARFDNTQEGFAKLLAFINKSGLISKPSNDSQWIFCMEHTGVYTLALSYFLERHNLAFVLVNPYHLKQTMGMRRAKNDRLDAAYIARYAYLHQDELVSHKLLSANLFKIKNLLSMRNRLVKLRKGINVAQKELSAFTDASLNQEVVEHSEHIVEPMTRQIQLIEKQILSLIKQSPEHKRLFDLVTSVKGVGIIIAATLLVYTAGFTAFQNSRQFAAFIGVAPFARSSGKSLKTPARVSHLAHKKLKGLFSCGASVALIYDKELKAYFQRRVAQGKNEFSVRTAVCNKFLHRIFAVVKRGTPYVELAQHKG